MFINASSCSSLNELFDTRPNGIFLCFDMVIRLLSQVNHRRSNIIIHPTRCKSDGQEHGILRAGDDER